MIRRLFPALTSAMLLLAATGDAADVPGPAASPFGIQPGLTDSKFTKPQYGPVLECSSTQRQFALLKTTVLAGEPVYLRMLVTTLEPDRRIEFSAQLSYGSDFRIFVQPPAGAPYEFVGLNLGSAVPASVVPFEGFTHFRTDFILATDAETVTGAAFDIPGKYTLRLSLNCNKKDAPSTDQHFGDFQLTVLPPTADEQAALDILDDHLIYRALQARGATINRQEILSQGQVTKLARVVSEARRSTIRPHAMIVLANYYKHKEDHEAAARLYQQVRAEYPGHPIAQEALFSELNMRMQETDHARSRELFLAAWRDPLYSQVIFPGSNQWKLFVEDYAPAPSTQWMVQETPGPDPQMEEIYTGPEIIISEEVQREWGLPAAIRSGDGAELKIPLGPRQ